MNIAICINDISNVGGTEIVSKAYAHCLEQEGNTVFFISMNYSSNVDIKDDKTCVLRQGNPVTVLSELDINKAYNYCEEKKIQKVLFVINIPYKGSPVSNLKLIKKISFVSKIEVIFHSSPKSYLKRYPNSEKGIIGNLLRRVKTMMILVPEAKKFIKTLPKYGVDIYTLNHGCQNELLNYYGVKSKIRYNTYEVIETFKNQKKNIVTYCGRLAFEKNISLLIKSWKEAKTDGWILRLIGNGSEVSYLKKLCSDWQLKNVEFIGAVNHSKIYEYLSESKICCLTSFNEGFPTIVVEAMNMRNAIITTKYDGFSEELYNSENTIITGYSVKEYTEALNKLLLNLTLTEKMGNAAFKKCKEFYTSQDYLMNK